MPAARGARTATSGDPGIGHDPGMRVAVLSDVHADRQALERVLDAVDRARADEVWCLGDIVGLGGSEPAIVVEWVRERATVALAGNHDRWVTGGLPLNMLALPAHRAELRWQLSRLSADQFEWLSGLSAFEERAGTELCHASAEAPLTAWIENQSDAGTHLAQQRVPLGLVGHTHRSFRRAPHRSWHLLERAAPSRAA